MSLLEADNVRRSFGGLLAVNGVSFRVARGQIKAVIGPNGAGKTTLFNIVSGLLAPDSGVSRKDRPRHSHRPASAIMRPGSQVETLITCRVARAASGSAMRPPGPSTTLST